MDTLKIRIKSGDFEIELEGDKDTVLKEFKALKENGISSLLGDTVNYETKRQNSVHDKEDVKTKKQVVNKIKSVTESSKEVKSKNKSKPNTFKLLTDLNYKPKGKESLVDFIKGLPFKSNVEMILGIVYYCKETLDVQNVTSDHIFTGFKELKIPIPPTLYQVIVNVKNRNGWITFDKMDDISYSIQGGNYVEHDLPKKKVSGKP